MNERVVGKCPSCKRDSLFVGAGGFVTCSHLNCPDPEAASKLLSNLGDDSDVADGRCCPHCRHFLTEHNTAVWNAGYSVGFRHAARDQGVGASR